MQLSGIGSGHPDSHQVTNCIHNHDASVKTDAAAAKVSATDSVSLSQQLVQEQNLTNVYSAGNWLEQTLQQMRQLWGRIWGPTPGTTDTAATGTMDAGMSANGTSANVGAATAMGVPTTQATVAAANTVTPPIDPARDVNPYFAAVDDVGKRPKSVWDKIKVNFENITGYLTKHFSFSGKQFFQAKQEKTKEDLSRRSRYRQDDVEIECVITDESYLMDSYNPKGEYSTLSAAHGRGTSEKKS